MPPPRASQKIALAKRKISKKLEMIVSIRKQDEEQRRKLEEEARRHRVRVAVTPVWCFPQDFANRPSLYARIPLRCRSETLPCCKRPRARRLAAQQRLCCSSLRCSGSSKTSSVSCLPCLRCSRSQRARQPPPRCAAANKNSSVTEIQSDIHRVKLSIATLTNDKVAADDSVQKAMAEVCVCAIASSTVPAHICLCKPIATPTC